MASLFKFFVYQFYIANQKPEKQCHKNRYLGVKML